MQNTVNQYIRNGLNFSYPHPVTYLYSGNNPANGLVTEILQYFTRYCFLTMWKNREYPLIMNRLRSLCSFPVSTAFLDFTHLARHTFSTTVTLANGISMESVSKMLGHSSILMTKSYARILDISIEKEMNGLNIDI